MQTFYSMKTWFQLKALNTKSFKPVDKRKKTSIPVIVTRYFCIGQNRCSLLKLIISRIATERGNTQRCKWVYNIVCLLVILKKKKTRMFMITFIMYLKKRLEHMFWITVILKPSQTLAWWVVKCSEIKKKTNKKKYRWPCPNSHFNEYDV